MRKFILFISLSFALLSGAIAQQRISGTVKGSDGLSIPGVSVLEKGTTNGITTDSDGKFQLSVSSSKSVIQFSFLGLKTIEEPVKVKGAYNITMISEDIGLEQVVITALVIKREQKSLGYSYTEVKGEEVNRVKDPNMINSLAGKVPGLVVTPGAAGPTGSTKVLLRGVTQMSGDNQPLYVVDGVPIINTNFGGTGTGAYATGYDMGDVISSMNPDDVESVNVLKGPSAAALYGSMASNGVILITTKKGTSKDLGIEFFSTSTVEQQGTTFNSIQSQYGQGLDGIVPANAAQSRLELFSSWGKKYDPNLMVPGWDGVARPYVYHPDNFGSFFKLGHSFNNTIGLSQSMGKTSVRLSFSNFDYEDIVPKTTLDRNTFNLTTNTQTGKLTVESHVIYMNEKVHNRPALADGEDNVTRTFLGLAGNIDQSVFGHNYKTSTGGYIDWNGGNSYVYNPYWVINDMYNTTNKDRLFGTLTLTYEFTKWLNLRVLGSADQNEFDFEKYSPITSPLAITGQLKQNSSKTLTQQADVMLTFDKDLSKDFRLTVRAGYNYFSFLSKGFNNTYSDQTLPEVVYPNAYSIMQVVPTHSAIERNSFYAQATVGFRNNLFVDATIRRDASSTLPTQNNTYAYPSLSVSYIFTDHLKKSMPSYISFGKIRASVAQVGKDADPYMLSQNYALYPTLFNGMSTGQVATASDGTSLLPNINLKPTRTKSFETGLVMKFLNNRIGFDFTYYKSSSRDQIMQIPIASSSGYGFGIVNAGLISNHGFELAFNATPVAIKNFTWNLDINWAKNINKVNELTSQIDHYPLAAARWLGVEVWAKPGLPYGTIMGYGNLKDPNGNNILSNDMYRTPEITTSMVPLGNGQFKWTGGILNSFKYKNFTLNATIDIKQGADILSLTNLNFAVNGLGIETLAGRDVWNASEIARNAAGATPDVWYASGNQKGFVPFGVINKGTDASPVYVKNTQGVSPMYYWGGSPSQSLSKMLATPFVYDASYIKLRDISLAYDIPKSFIKKANINAITLSLVARNPLIIKKNVPNIDPDSNYQNGNGQGIEYGSLPSRKSYGVSLKIKF